MYEINCLFDRLTGMRQFDPDWIIRLHSSLTPEEQSRAFAIPPMQAYTPAHTPTPILAEYMQGALELHNASPETRPLLSLRKQSRTDAHRGE